MPNASKLVNRAYLFSKLRFWDKEAEAESGQDNPINFTFHMVALTTKLVNMRASDGTEEFKALCKVFRLPMRVRKKLLSTFLSTLRDPLPAEYHARQIALLHKGKPTQREAVLERLIKVAAASRFFIGRNEYLFLRSIALALEVSPQHFLRLCVRYEIEVPSDNPYVVLGVSRLASKKEIRNKYHRLVREYHPDVIQGEGYSLSEAQAFNQKLAEINQAYHTLQSAD